MNKKLGIISLGIVLAGTLISFTINHKSTISNSNILEKAGGIRETFVISNSKSISLPIESIDKIHWFNANEKGGGFRCVTTGSPGATDVGAYNELYFLFENDYEMPHRTATFKIGNLGHINSFKKISKSKYEIKGWMFEYSRLYTEEDVVITIDASNVINQEIKHDNDNTDFEGEMSSKIVVYIESV